MSAAHATQPLGQAMIGLWHQGLGYVQDQPLLQVALGAIALVVLGGMIRGFVPLAGGFLRFVGNVALIYAMIAAIAHVAGKADLSLDTNSGSEADQQVTGHDTRVTMGPDGHFWVRARMNGVERRFLVDTGATLTTLTPDSADAAAIRPKRWGEQVLLNTANGRTAGELATIDTLAIGNITARHVDAVVAPGLATNVLGMNVLSRLASWRVEGRVMILVPKKAGKQETE